MSDEFRNQKKYIVFNLEEFNEEQRKKGGQPANAVLGWVWARDENYAKDTAETIFFDRHVFVRDWDSADQVYKDAAIKMGGQNTSPAHTDLG
jgi:hypothetical protein